MIIIPTTREKSGKDGRSAAKKSIQEYFLRKNNLKIETKDILIRKEKNGRPFFIINKSLIDSSEFSLSISHTDKYVIAEISDKGYIGIDIENIRKFSKRVFDNFLTENEKNWIITTKPSKIDTYTTLYWSFKESYLKALGVGLRIHPKKVEIRALNNDRFIIKTGVANHKSYLWYNVDHSKGYLITKVILKK